MLTFAKTTLGVKMGRIIIFALLAALFISCDNQNSLNDANTSTTKTSLITTQETFVGDFKTSLSGRRIEIKQELHDIAFYDDEGNVIQLNHTPEGLGIGGSVYIYGYGNDLTVEGGDIKADYFKPDLGYKTSDGKIGKTYTEEFEDKQGNLRTKIYENGLLVSYKINGVEQ
jgi:hypothetical protein